MPAFQYAALDARGRTRKGLLEGDTARQVRQLLRERELLPIEVREIAAGRGFGVGVPGGRRAPVALSAGRLRAAELALLTRQLATLIGAGLPLEQALQTVAGHSGGRNERLLLALRARVLEGRSLAAALADFPRAFPDLYRATIAAGEGSGHLAPVLERLADYAEQRQQLRQKTGLALFYPLLLTAVAILIIVGLLTYVVPQVVQVFVSMDQRLPALTRGLLALAEFCSRYGPALLAVGVTSALAFGYAIRRYRRFRAAAQRLWLRLPLLGRLARGLDSARFARTFGILLESGVPVLEALRISTQVIALLPMRDAVDRAAERVKEGGALARALAEGGYFPPLMLQLIASGEASGRLDEMLDQAARQQERESQTLIAALLALFEPLLILTMGVLVLLIVLAVLLPIFDLNQMIR